MDIPYFYTDKLRIYNSDFLKLTALPNNSVDLTVTSPPYDLDIQYESYKDNIPYDKYLEFSEKWLKRCFEMTIPTGRLCLNIPICTSKGHQSTCADLTVIAKQVGWKHRTTIVWDEQSVTKRTAWGSWLSASAPHVMSPAEAIVVMHKGEWKRNHSGVSDITKEEFIKWTIGTWKFCGEKKSKIGHPAPFPVELPKRCIKLFSYKNDIVLDPFLGSGTTLIACHQTGRIGVGVEIDQKYCDLSVERLKKELR